MDSRRVFYLALLISAAAHGIILLQNPNLSLFSLNTKEKNIEVSYVRTPQETKTQARLSLAKREPLLRTPPKITASQTKLSPPGLDRNNALKPSKTLMPASPALFDKPLMAKPDIIAVTKKITIAPLEMDKSHSPAYLSYCELVHETIKRTLRLNYTGTETGVVSVSFVLTSDGTVRDVRILEKNTSFSRYLRELTLKGVRVASGFPKFPPALDYPELTFNAIVSYQIE